MAPTHTWWPGSITRITTYDVYGRVISRSGSFVTSAFVIANASGVGFNTFDESPTDIAYNSSSHQFLVVWETEVSLGNSQWDIWARHVSPSGTMGSYLQIATTASTERDAAAAYNPDSDQYLVVWGSVNKATAVAEVIGRRLTGSGTVITTDNILISTAWAEDARPDVIYRAASGRYLAAWQQTEDIYSRGVLPDGTLAGSATVIANTVQKEANPRLAADEAGLLLIWQRHNSSTGDDVYGRALNNSGHPTGSPFPIQETAGAQQRPAIAYGANGRSQLAWQDDREGGWDLYTASLDHRYQVTHIQYDYDPLYRLVSADYSGDFDGEYAYAYDAVGNRTAYTTTITGTTVITYQYDAANRLLESVEVGGDTTTYEWDDAGRLITTTVGLNISRVYTYSQDGDLTAALVDGLLTTFVYDGQGHRLQMSVADEVVTYTLDYAAGSRVLFEEGGAFSDTKHYLYGLACLGEQVDADDAQNSAWRYYQRDGQNLVRQTTNEETAVTLAWTFTPEGAVLLGEEGPVTNLDCSGNAIYDFSTGLIFKNGNYFDPSNGIWITLSGVVIYQVWVPQRDKRRSNGRERKWLYIFLFLLLIVLFLAGCGDGERPALVPLGSTPTSACPPTATPSYREIEYPLDSQLKGYFIFVDGDPYWHSNGQLTQAWTSDEMMKVALNLEDAVLGANGYVGEKGFLTTNEWANAFGISHNKPVRLVRQSGNVAQATWQNVGTGTRPYIALSPRLGGLGGVDTLRHEMAHLWDGHYGWQLSKGMNTAVGRMAYETDFINHGYFSNYYGETGIAFDMSSDPTKEDFAESVRGYLKNGDGNNPHWSDDYPEVLAPAFIDIRKNKWG